MKTLHTERASLCLGLLALLLCALPAAASVGPPIKVTITPTPGVYPQPGLPFNAELEIVSGQVGVVRDFELHDATRNAAGGPERWNNTSFSIPPGTPVQVNEMEPLLVQFSATPSDPTEPVSISFLWNDQLYTQQFGLYPENDGLGKSGDRIDMTVEEPWGPDPRPLGKTDIESVPPLLYETPEGPLSPQEAADDAKVEAGKGRNIRVKGRIFCYRGPDGHAIGLDSGTVRIKDEDWEWDDTLAVFSTDPWGYFDVTFYYDQGEDPDIYMEFETANSRVEVENSNIWENNYKFRTGTWGDYTGSFIDFGWRRPSNSAKYPALYIHTTVTRAYRWVKDYGGYITPSVCVQWPESDGNSWYNPFWEEIHINTGKQWKEDTMSHEYGHHWVENFANDTSGDYCNPAGRCDDPGDCGHCLWCEESGGDAWREGFPDMQADFVTSMLGSIYGSNDASLNFRNMEAIGMCGESSQYDNAWQTEGHCGALLRDIIDSTVDDDPAYSQGIDVMDLSASEIYNLVATYEPVTPQAFLNVMYTQYPNLKSQIWQVAENNGYNFTDTTDPSQVSGLTSTSHSTVGDSPDATIDFVWTKATDNLSGVDGYSIALDGSPSTLPNTTKNIEDVSGVTVFAPSAGYYYFHIRSVDNAGNWDNTAAHYGPIQIRDPYPADFAPQNPLWPAGVMPSNGDICGWNYCPTPTSLPGNAQTHFNVGYRNNGELPSTGVWKSLIYIDGVAVGGILNISATVQPGQTYTATGLGPFTVKGGRHTFGSMIDYNEQHPEIDETDNLYAGSWVWSPYSLSTGTIVSRTAPPEAYGGRTSVSVFASPNCDGFRATRINDTFYGVAMWNDDLSEDYDLRLHTMSSGPTNGFATLDALLNGATSSRPAGCLDFALFRHDVAGANTYDAGIVNFDGGVGGFKVVKEFSSNIAMGFDYNITIPADRHLAMREINPLFAQTFTVSIDVDPASGPVQVALFDDQVGLAGLTQANASAMTDQDGHAQFDYVTGTGGPMCVVVYQDPKDVPTAKRSAAINVTLKAQTTPGDLTSATPAGWYAPVVPRPTNDGTNNSVPMPTFLQGNVDQTYVNWAWQNIGPNSSPSVNGRVMVDGKSKIYSLMGPVSPNSTVTSNIGFPITVKGGRHTMHAHYDVNETFAESNEENNGWGLQYVWNPLVLNLGAPVTRQIPEPLDAGWNDALLGGIVVVHPNADGLRTPGPEPLGDDGHWQAVATMPGAASDVDLRLHEQSTGALNGFDSVRAMSGWVTGLSDFVITNYRATAPYRQMDVGVNYQGGWEDYTAEVVDSVWLASKPQGSYGSFKIEPGQIMDLHEVYLEAGPTNVTLLEESGNVDWGISIHEGGLAYHNKEAGLTHGISWMEGEGELEAIYVEVPADGYYCLAVWKTDHAQLSKNGVYRLLFSNATDTPDTPLTPIQSALTSIHPNPFNPRTTIAFDLAQDGPVSLMIFNVRGELVRTLLREPRPAGRHEISWDGIDDRGDQVASGSYFARMVAGKVVMQRKLTLVK